MQRLEASLAEPIVRHFRRQRFNTLLREAPFYDYRIDVFGFSSTDDLTVAIELKLAKWRRAFEQALIYQLCADQVFVAMPQEAIPSIDLDQFRENGIGLISISNADRCRLIIPATPSSVVRSHYRDQLVHLLKEFA